MTRPTARASTITIPVSDPARTRVDALPSLPDTVFGDVKVAEPPTTAKVTETPPVGAPSLLRVSTTSGIAASWPTKTDCPSP